MKQLIIFINDLATDLFYDKTTLIGEELFQKGACYELYLIISSLIDNTSLYEHKKISHVAIKYNGKLYDSKGQIEDEENYKEADSYDISYIKEYYGEAYRYLKITKTIIKEVSKIDIKLPKKIKKKVL